MMRHDSGTYPFCCADQPGEARDLCKDVQGLPEH